VFWSLLVCILEHHVELLKTKFDPHTTTVEDLIASWDASEETLMVLVQELYQRYKSLQRSWRSQKLDVEVEVECYAGGFFYGWYEEVCPCFSEVTYLVNQMGLTQHRQV
jgi:hypothetical protein